MCLSKAKFSTYSLSCDTIPHSIPYEIILLISDNVTKYLHLKNNILLPILIINNSL